MVAHAYNPRLSQKVCCVFKASLGSIFYQKKTTTQLKTNNTKQSWGHSSVVEPLPGMLGLKSQAQSPVFKKKKKLIYSIGTLPTSNSQK